jgi:hypothetical protein
MATKHNPNGSTGPKTPQDKAASSMNALRSGIYASTTILPGEDPAEFDRLHDGLQSFYEPENPFQQKLVDEVAALEWKTWRVELIEASILTEFGDAFPSACVQPYDRITQVRCRLRRAWHKVLHLLEAIRIARQPKAPANAKASRPSKPKAPKQQEEFLNTAEEYYSQDFSSNAKSPMRAAKLEIWRRNGPGGNPLLLSRLYKGQNVEEFPADDPAEICNKYL